MSRNRIQTVSDVITESVIYFMVIFSPWAFGTTQRWSIWTLNIAGYVLGGTLALKVIARWRARKRFPVGDAGTKLRSKGPPSPRSPIPLTPAPLPSDGRGKFSGEGESPAVAKQSGTDHQSRPNRTPSPGAADEVSGGQRSNLGRGEGGQYAESPLNRGPHFSSRMTIFQAVLTVLILAYCLISALNARATYDEKTQQFIYHQCFTWLPHSYDSQSSWFAFWNYLALGLTFWAIRDWLLPPGRGEGEGGVGGRGVGSSRVDLQACKLEYSIVSPK